jgi:hypothetical protein
MIQAAQRAGCGAGPASPWSTISSNRARSSRRSDKRRSDRAYFIIRSQLSAGKPQVREFAEWLVAEAGGNAKEDSG